MTYLFKNLHVKAKIQTAAGLITVCTSTVPQFSNKSFSCERPFSQEDVKIPSQSFQMVFFKISFQNRKGNTHRWCVFVYLPSKCVGVLNLSVIVCAADVKKNNMCRVSQRLWEILFKGFRPSVGPMGIKSRINS